MDVKSLQRGGTSSTNVKRNANAATGGNTSTGSSWVKGPWGVCFPPQLHVNVQQLTDRLKLEPAPKLSNNNKNRNTSPTSVSSSNSSPSTTSSTTTKHKNKSSRHHHHHQNQHQQNEQHQCVSNNHSERGYEFEHKEDTEGNIYVMPLEQAAAFAFSDDDSEASWSSQNAVKFNKKLKPKVADHGLSACASKEARTLADPAAYEWEHAWGTKPSDSSTGSREDTAEHRAPSSKDNNHNSNGRSAWHSEKRDESEQPVPSPSAVLSNESQMWSLNLDMTDQDEYSELQPTSGTKSIKSTSGSTLAVATTRSESLNTQQSHIGKQRKSVRFTEPLVTCQYFRPKTRPEDVSLLYFDEDELELLEEDRENTSRDQFEMIAQELSENRLRISIAYQNRWRDHQRRRSGHSSAAATTSVSASSSNLLVTNSTSDV
ncbi:expressed unknown protein [Seminavis robusta]|uniref:Uncharacterized protein n=1 Tax=Seminavis robusta TaxID=568900 RepID=A0A9N8H893_9STRA|nr:expressed unknown protein [Seminavis robusta]|eukprot:Sro209_g087370.1 n/a (430) ;mRNA; f:54104-55393